MRNKTNNLEQKKTNELVELFLNEETKTIQSLKQQKNNITKAIDLITRKINSGGRVVYIGAGTSGRLAVLDAVECIPTFNSRSFVPVLAGGKKAMFKAQEGAEDDKKQAIKELQKIKLNENDILVGVSASGETPYTVSALTFAKKRKINIVAITSNPTSTLAKLTSYKIVPLIKNEIIQGSSRLKSGTAQKIILNMLSSISMIKLGKVYGNLMIDVRPTNKKLIKRAIGIISTICNISFNKAKTLFSKSKRSIRTAIAMHYKNN